MTISRPERFTAIMKAHVAALGDRDHRDVSAAELFPKIAEAVPGVTHEEIIAAFQHTADRAIEQARQLLPTFPSGRIHDILNCVIHAPDRTALAIAFAQGHEAGSEGRGSPEDVPALYRTAAERMHEGSAWYQGHIAGDSPRQMAEEPLRAPRVLQA